MDGLTSFANISTTFPHISSCRLVASDKEIGHLNDLPHLRQLEVANHLKERKSDVLASGGILRRTRRWTLLLVDGAPKQSPLHSFGN